MTSAPRSAWEPVEPSLSEVTVGLAARGAQDVGPVSLAAVSDADHGRRFEVEVLDEAVAEQVGAAGFVFRLEDLSFGGADPERLDDGVGSGSGEIEVEVDYSSVAGRFGGGFGARLELRVVPACALEESVPEGCRVEGVPLEVTNSSVERTVTARVPVDASARVTLRSGPLASNEALAPRPAKDVSSIDGTDAEELGGGEPSAPSTTTSTTIEAESTGQDAGGVEVSQEGDVSTSTTDSTTTTTTVPQGSTTTTTVLEPSVPEDAIEALGGGTVLMLTAGVSGGMGSYASTPLSMASSWNVGPGAGGFSWSYPVPVQPGPAGDRPTVALSYSSALIDGMVGMENNQAPMAGSGWGVTEAFVERRYVPCSREGISGASDLCWRKDNAVLHLNGVTTELVYKGNGFWRARQDPNWKIQKFTGASNGDDDGEYWQVTTTDGTRYQFGRGPVVSEGSVESDSTYTVAVWGDDAGDPCAGGFGFCRQAWRWNVDRVIDPLGNRMQYSYVKETNKHLLHSYNSDIDYDRGGRLAWIEYGLREQSDAQAQARVVFDATYRCVDTGGTCSAAPTRTNGADFPDVPSDLICSSGCSEQAPAFFSGKRYTQIRTQTFYDGSFHDVDRIRLTHQFVDNGEDQDANGVPDSVLWLRYLEREGNGASADITLPAMRFEGNGQLLVNRRDANPGAGALELKQWRLGRIYTDTGARIDITYGQQNPCTTIPAGSWHTQETDCFPRVWDPPGASVPGWAIWNKWLVTQVSTFDLVGGQPEMRSTYTYHDGAGWHFDSDPMATATEIANGDYSWNEWRGYFRTQVTEGTGTTKTRTEHRMFRGMHGDRQLSGTRSVNVQAGDGASYADENWLRSLPLDTRYLNSAGSAADRAVKHEYEAHITAGTGSIAARWVGENATIERFGDSTVTRNTTTSYHTDHWTPYIVVEGGWSNTATDNRCNVTNYAVDETRWMLTYVSHRITREGSTCGSSEAEVRNERYFYGTATHHELANDGELTRAESDTNPGAIDNYEPRAVTTYDALGRAAEVRDGRDHPTTTVYSPASTNSIALYPETMTVTNAKGHQTTTDLHSRYIGSPVEVTDPNGNITGLTYDAVGRLSEVWLPTEQPPSSHPSSLEYLYDLTEGSSGYGLANPAWVRTRTLQTDASTPEYVYGTVTYDGLLRSRQVGEFSAGTSLSVISRTAYDSRGLAITQTIPQESASWPQDLNSVTWQNHTSFTHDAHGRVTTEEAKANGTTQWTQTTAYTYKTATITPPAGYGQRRTTTDGHGQTSKVEEHDGTTWHAASYDHNAAGDLVSITDPDSNVISYTYNPEGQRLTMADPDAGAWSYAYDDAGNQQRVTDADPSSDDLWSVYDELNRQTGRYAGDPTASGTLLASWAFDATGEKGLLDKSTRHDPTYGDLVTDITGYDPRGRPIGKTWTIPTGAAGALAGTYGPVTTTYDAADHPVQTAYPATAGLTAETITIDYGDLHGRGETLTGSGAYSDDDYISAVTFDDHNRIASRTLGTGINALTRTYTYRSQDQRLDELTLTRSTTTLQADKMNYDHAGNVVSIEHKGTAPGGHKECFTYDPRQRLKDAYTTTSNYTCLSGTAPRGLAPTGETPYNHTYTYANDGRMLTGNHGPGTWTYTYDTTQPHAVDDLAGTGAPTNDCNGATTGTPTHCYDPNGNMTGRPGPTTGETATMTWDDEHRLTQVDNNGPAAGGDLTTFAYDADGQRLIRATPSDTTIYLDGHEVTATGTSVTAKRYYTLAGVTVAMRDSATGALTYLLGDQLGSTSVSVNAAGGAPVVQRYLPYGAPRSTTGGSAVTDRGWIGQTKDTTTGLQYLNARYYDPTVGRFAGVDPIVDTAQPGSLDRFGYALGSPVTLKDPTGLWTPVGDTRHGGSYDGRRQLAISKPLGTPTKVRLPGKKYTPVYPRPDLVDVGIEPPFNNPFPPFYPPGYGPRPVPAKSQTEQDQSIWDAGMKVLSSSGPQGICAGGSVFAAIGGGVSGCRATVGDETGVLITPEFGAGSPAASGGPGVLYTNAESLGALGGRSSCISGGASGVVAGASASVCGSVGGSGVDFTGTVAVILYAEAGASLPGPVGSATRGETLVLRADPLNPLSSWWDSVWAPFAPGGNL